MIIYDKSGTIILDIDVDDNSYRYRAIMNGTKVTLYYSLTEHVEIPIDSYVVFQGQRYSLWLPSNFKKHGTRNFEYTVEFGGDEQALKKYKLKDTTIVPHKLKFSFVGTPRQLLQLFVDNLNLREKGWTVGKCIELPERLFSFNNEFIYDALNRTAGDLKTEWNIANKTMDLCKVELFKDAPLVLSYGKGKGFLPGTGRANIGDKQPVTLLYVQGGERNIDASKYGSTTLLLPLYQELEYEGRKYHTSKDGTYIYRSDLEVAGGQEDGYDGSEIYPSRIGTVSEVIVVDAEEHFYEFKDSSIPEALDFSKYRIAGQKATIIFQSGRLAGREFDIDQTDDALTGYVHSERRFKLIPIQTDGQTLPNTTFYPSVNDKYAVFGISLPDAYICDNATKTGASWDMFREAARVLYEKGDNQFSFTGELDGAWAKRRWLEVGGKIIPGGYVLFSDTQYQQEGVLIRQTGVRDYINKPHNPKIELSNVPVAPSKSSVLDKIDADEVTNEDRYKNALSFTMRRYQDMVETGKMLEAAIEGFSASINPVTVSTMQIRLGAEQLQFRFVANKTSPMEIIPDFVMNNTSKVFTAPSCILQHMSLGITKLSPTHTPNEYKFWNMSAYTSPYLGDDKSPYYLYAKCSKSGTTGTFLLSKEPHKMEEGSNYYFLVGTLGTEWEKIRSFTTCYGFTEILPGRMIINLITSTDGRTYFNLAEGVIGGRIRFDSGTTGYENISDKPDLSIYGTTALLNAVKNELQNQIDGKIEMYYQTSNPWQGWPSGTEPTHVGDLWYNTGTKVLQKYVGPSSNTWAKIEDADAIAAAQAAATAKDTADGKRRVFISTPYPPYDAGDQWITYGTKGGSMRICRQGRQSGSYVSSDWQLADADGNTQASVDRGVFSAAGYLTFGPNGVGSAGMVGDGDIRIWSGGPDANRATFQVLASGEVVAKKAIRLQNSEAGITGVGMDSTSVRFWAGGPKPESAIFRVTQGGKVIGSDCQFTGGSIGGFKITGGRLVWEQSAGFGGTSKSLKLGSGNAKEGVINVYFDMSTDGNYGVKSVGRAAGGACVFASANYSPANYPDQNSTYAGFFDGPLLATSYFTKHSGTVYSGVSFEYGDYDLDKVRFQVKNGLVTGVRKE